MRLLFVSMLYVLIIVLPMITESGHALYFGNDVNVTNHSELPSSSLTSSPKQLAATEKGDVYVVWVDNNSIYITSSDDNQKKFGSKIILSQVDKLGLSPQVFATEKGDVYVVWVNKNNKTGYSNIEFISSNDSGKTFGPQKELRTGTSISYFPQLAATEKGDVYVVWVDKNNKTGYSNIEFISSNDSGRDFTSSKKLTGSKSLSFFPQLTATEKGNVYVVWVDKNNKTGDTDIIFRSSNDSGMRFDDRNKLRRSESLLSISPQLAATEKGNVYVVWVDKNITTGDSDIAFRTSNDAGSDFERTINLNKGENKESNSSLPQVATTQKDSVYVVWLDNQIKFKEILVKDALVGNTISLSNKTTSSLSPQITATKNGNLFVIWGDKNNNTIDNSLHFKRISGDYFDRNS
jgi:BNR repeat-containing family member